jgi:hypothetical protein
MGVTFVRGILALPVVALLLLAPASPARAAILTLEFTGTYDTGNETLFGLSGPAVPFAFSLTYDTSLDTNTVFCAAGTTTAHGNTLLEDFYGYSKSGIIASTLTFGSHSWTPETSMTASSTRAGPPISS